MTQTPDTQPKQLWTFNTPFLKEKHPHLPVSHLGSSWPDLNHCCSHGDVFICSPPRHPWPFTLRLRKTTAFRDQSSSAQRHDITTSGMSRHQAWCQVAVATGMEEAPVVRVGLWVCNPPPPPDVSSPYGLN